MKNSSNLTKGKPVFLKSKLIKEIVESREGKIITRDNGSSDTTLFNITKEEGGQISADPFLDYYWVEIAKQISQLINTWAPAQFCSGPFTILSIDYDSGRVGLCCDSCVFNWYWKDNHVMNQLKDFIPGFSIKLLELEE